jgi:hypothetical protein
VIASVQDPNTRWTDGFMCHLPDADWQTALGGKILIGQGPFSIVGSLGWPLSLFSCDPEDMAEGETFPTELLLHYRETQTMNGYGSGDAPFPGGVDDMLKIQHDTYNGTTKISAVVAVEGTRTVAFFGHHAYGTVTYSGTYVSTDFRRQVWLYDGLDLERVRLGSMNPWDCLPYAVQNFHVYQPSGSASYVAVNTLQSEGAFHDAGAARVYVVVPTENAGFDPTTRVHAYSYSTVATSTRGRFAIAASTLTSMNDGAIVLG